MKECEYCKFDEGKSNAYNNPYISTKNFKDIEGHGEWYLFKAKGSDYELVTEVETNYGSAETCIAITHCPMCGRKL